MGSREKTGSSDSTGKNAWRFGRGPARSCFFHIAGPMHASAYNQGSALEPRGDEVGFEGTFPASLGFETLGLGETAAQAF